jgi:hypothetical protein
MDGTPREDWQEEHHGRIDPLERRLRKVRYEVEVGERGRETGSLL